MLEPRLFYGCYRANPHNPGRYSRNSCCRDFGPRLRLFSRSPCSEAIKNAHAPSLTPDAFPAVTVQSGPSTPYCARMRGLINLQPIVVSSSCACREKGLSAFPMTKGARLMDSTSPANAGDDGVLAFQAHFHGEILVLVAAFK